MSILLSLPVPGAVGKHILAAAAPAMKRVILELGGKDAMIVLADADLDAAAKICY